jgi:signal transduction histidine kinase
MIASPRQAKDAGAQRARLEQVLRRSSATFLASALVHELSQPLTAINTWSAACLRLADAYPESRTKLIERLEYLVAESRRATEIIRNFRASVHRYLPEPHDIDVNDILSSVADMLGEEARAAEIAISLALEKAAVPVCADQTLLAVAVFILCRNSLDALKSHDNGRKEVHIISRRMGKSGIRVSVRDTGPGLDEGSVARLFEPLSSTKPYGAGIGLALCRTMIEGMGGRLWLEANAPTGATFAFEIKSGLDGEEGDGAAIGESAPVRSGR